LKPIPEFWMYGDLAVDSVFLLWPNNIEQIPDATTGCKNLVVPERYDLGDPEPCVYP
jgi:hypothetical protein